MTEHDQKIVTRAFAYRQDDPEQINDHEFAFGHAEMLRQYFARRLTHADHS